MGLQAITETIHDSQVKFYGKARELGQGFRQILIFQKLSTKQDVVEKWMAPTGQQKGPNETRIKISTGGHSTMLLHIPESAQKALEIAQVLFLTREGQALRRRCRWDSDCQP